ncbi:tetratricopeptide repeat protein 28-like [Heptranchias perlo]|uniref:tetratricopeptide repeat protein 28-like n=1 Tax=Heptranchias perlo TaxID=212740 RepID=UPI0035594E43
MISEADQSSMPTDPPCSPESASADTITDSRKVTCLQVKGDEALKEGKYQEAVSCYTRALGLDSKDCQLRSCRAVAFIQMKQYEDARLDGEVLTQLQPEAPQNHYLLSLANGYLGHLPEAFRSLLRCLELDSTHQEEIVKDLHRVTKKLCKGETEDNNYCYDDEKGLDEVLLQIGSLLCDASLHDLCIQLVSSAMQLYRSTMSDPIRMQFCLIHANCYSAANNEDMARAAYENCLKLALGLSSIEEKIKCYASLAAIHMKSGCPEEAIRYYLELLATLELSEQQPWDNLSRYERQSLSTREFWSPEREMAVYLNLTEAYCIIHQYQKALIFGKKYLEHLIGGPPRGYCQEVTSAYRQVAKLQDKLEFYSESLINYQQYCELSKMLGNFAAEAEAHGAMGMVHAALGNCDLAITHAHQSFNLSRAVGERQLRLAAQIRLGDVYRITENLEEAANWYQQAWDHDSRGDDPKLKCQAALGIAEVYKGTAHYQHALYFYEQALEAAEVSGDDELIYKCKFNIACICQFSYSAKELMKGCKAFEGVIAYYHWLSRKYTVEGTVLPKEISDILLESYDGIQSVLEKLGDRMKTLQYAEAGRRHRFLTCTFMKEEVPHWNKAMDESSAALDVPSLEELYNILDAVSVPVLYYSLVETGLFLWVLKPKEGLVHFHSTNSAESEDIHRQICQFLQLLKNRSLLYETEARNIPKRRSRRTTVGKQNKRWHMPSSSYKDPGIVERLLEDGRETEHWKQMYLLLIGPATDLLEELQKGSNLLIVPDKQLIQVPFASLPDLKNKKLGKRFCVTLAPSLFAIEAVANLTGAHVKNQAESSLGAAVGSGSISTMAMLEKMGGSHQELCGLQKLGLMDTVTHLVNCTSTNTIVARSPYLIPPFKQVFSRSRALVVGSPHFPSALSLWGRVWKPWGPLIGAQKEVIKVAEYLQTEAVMGEEATKKRVLSELPLMQVVHIATYGSWEDGVLLFTPHPPPAAGELVEERSYLLTIPEILELKLKARIVVLSSCGEGGTAQDPVLPLELPTAFLRAGASAVLLQIKPVPVQASLTFFHHFYIALWNGSYVSVAMEYAKYQMQNDARFGRFWCCFVLLGLDTFINLLEIKCDMLHQTMENIEQEVAHTSNQDWLNPAPYTPAVPDQEALLLKIQKSLEELIVNHGSMSSVLKLLHLLMKEAIKRLYHTNTDHVTVKLTANIIGIPGVSSMLDLLGFRFQSLASIPPKMGDRTFQPARESAAMGDVSHHSTLPLSNAHPVAVIFPHWNPDKLICVAQQAIAALIDLSACSQCVNALIWILPLTRDRLEQLITLLEKNQSSPTVCPRLTEKGVATLWNQPHLRDFLQVIGYEQAGLYLFHNPRDLNKSLLLGSLSLFLALRPQPLQGAEVSKPDPQQYSSASVREEQSRQGPQETSTPRDEQTRQDAQETSTSRDEQTRQDLQETSTPRDEQTRQDAQETSTSRDEQTRQDPQETSTLRDEQTRQDAQETSTLRDEQTRQGPQETSTPRDEQTRQDAQETSTSRDEQTRQDPQETSTLRDEQTRQGPQETSTSRDEQTRQDAQETSTSRDEQTRQDAQETSTSRDEQTRQGPQETSILKDEQTRQGPQETSTSRDEQTRQDAQETSILKDEQTRQGPQETSILKDEQTRQGPQETSTSRDKQTRQDSLETSAPGDEQTRQGPEETSTLRDKQTRQGPQETSTSRAKKTRQDSLETSTSRGKKTRQGPQETSADTVRGKKNKQGPQENATDSKRTTYPSGKSKVHLNTLKPLLVLRHQIMMQAPWLTVKPTSEELRVKHGLAQSMSSLHSQQQAHLHCLGLWHKKTLQELERKPGKRENKRQDCTPKKVKVKGPRTPSDIRTPLDEPPPIPVSQNVALRSTAQKIIKEQEENVRHRHRAAVKDLFLPFIDPLP